MVAEAIFLELVKYKFGLSHISEEINLADLTEGQQRGRMVGMASVRRVRVLACFCFGFILAVAVAVAVIVAVTVVVTVVVAVAAWVRELIPHPGLGWCPNSRVRAKGSRPSWFLFYFYCCCCFCCYCCCCRFRSCCSCCSSCCRCCCC